MKARLRWYGLGLEQLAFRRVAEAMSKLEYTRRRAAGFRLSEVRRDHIVGTFIERLEWDDTVEDPAGGALTIHRVEVRQVGFRLDAARPELQLSDPPRSLRGFVDKLSECFEERIVLTPITILPTQWLAELEKIAGAGTVLVLTGSGLTLSPATSASIHLDGTEDVRRYVSKLAQGKPLKVERIIVRLREPNAGRCELLAGGRAVITDGHEETIGTLRDALRNAALQE